VTEIHHSKPWITDGDRRAVRNVLESGMLAQGANVTRFEQEVASYHGCLDAIAAASGTAALMVGLDLLGVKPGSEIIVPTYACDAIRHAVQAVGATPVPCDTGPHTWNVTSDSVAARVSEKTAAVIVVHTFGIPADVSAIGRLGVPVIEDCAQAFGTRIGTGTAGSAGDIGVYSFNATKCLTTGEGGMLVTGKPEMADRFRALRREPKKHGHRMSDMQAALGLSQLERYADFLRRRRGIADLYFSRLPPDLIGRLNRCRQGNIFFRFPVFGDIDFPAVRQVMAERGIHVRSGVDALIHRPMGLHDDDFPNAMAAFVGTCCIPIYPALTDGEIEAIIAAFDHIAGRCGPC